MNSWIENVANRYYNTDGKWYGDRGLCFGGYDINNIEYITISVNGNSIDFGDLLIAGGYCKSASNGVIGCTTNQGANRNLSKNYFANLSNAILFGQLSVNRTDDICAFSNGIRLFTLGGSASNVIDYVLFSYGGTAVDFGDAIHAGYFRCAVVDGNRSIIGGSNDVTNVMELITMSINSNATTFGQLPTVTRVTASVYDSTRGIFSPGYSPVGPNHYVTMATTANSSTFGEITNNGPTRTGVTNLTKGVFFSNNIIQYVTISVLSAASEFGETTKFTGSYKGYWRGGASGN